MKKSIIILAVLAFVGTSCSEFLNVQPEGTATSTTYFTNDQQAIDAVDALYERFHQEGWYGRNMFWEQAAANDIVWGRNASDIRGLAIFEPTGNEGVILNVYERAFSTIARANYIILSLTKKTSLTDVEKRSLGEAYFCRAWAHYCIAYRYGTKDQGVPFHAWEKLDLETGHDRIIPEQQKSVLDNFQYIIDDLDEAINNLPKFEEYKPADQGRAHDAAAVAFKAKVYAYWATWDATKWNNVITLVNSLETDYGRDLAPTFEELFSSDLADFWPKEYIWSIPGYGGSSGGGVEFVGIILENKGWGKYNGWGQMKPTEQIYQEMLKDGEGNTRLLKSILTYGQEFQFFGETRKFYSESDLDAGFQINKYMDIFKYENPVAEGAINSNGNWPTGRINFPVIRFAEMLLFRAEAYLATGDAAKAAADINRIRVRSGLTPLAGNATWTDLYHERRCELAFEFTDHLYDLKRWYLSSNTEIQTLAKNELNSQSMVRFYENRADVNSTYTVGPYVDYNKTKEYNPNYMVFPYPSDEITKSNGKLKQNAGY